MTCHIPYFTVTVWVISWSESSHVSLLTPFITLFSCFKCTYLFLLHSSYGWHKVMTLWCSLNYYNAVRLMKSQCLWLLNCQQSSHTYVCHGPSVWQSYYFHENESSARVHKSFTTLAVCKYGTLSCLTSIPWWPTDSIDFFNRVWGEGRGDWKKEQHP